MGKGAKSGGPQGGDPGGSGGGRARARALTKTEKNVQLGQNRADCRGTRCDRDAIQGAAR